MRNIKKILILLSCVILSSGSVYAIDMEDLRNATYERDFTRNNSIELNKLYIDCDINTSPAKLTVREYFLRNDELVYQHMIFEKNKDNNAYTNTAGKVYKADNKTIIKSDNTYLFWCDNKLTRCEDNRMLDLLMGREAQLYDGKLFGKLGETEIPVVVLEAYKNGDFFIYKDRCYQTYYTNIYLTKILDRTDDYNIYAEVLNKKQLAGKKLNTEDLYNEVLTSAAKSNYDVYQKYKDIFTVTAELIGDQIKLDKVFSGEITKTNAMKDFDDTKTNLIREGWDKEIVDKAIGEMKTAADSISYIQASQIKTLKTGNWIKNSDGTYSYSLTNSPTGNVDKGFYFIKETNSNVYNLFMIDEHKLLKTNYEYYGEDKVKTINAFNNEGYGTCLGEIFRGELSGFFGKSIADQYNEFASNKLAQWQQTETIDQINNAINTVQNQKKIADAKAKADALESIKINTINANEVEWKKEVEGWRCNYKVKSTDLWAKEKGYVAGGFYAIPDGTIFGNSQGGGRILRIYNFNDKGYMITTGLEKTPFNFNSDGQVCYNNSVISGKSVGELIEILNKDLRDARDNINNSVLKEIQNNIPVTDNTNSRQIIANVPNDTPATSEGNLTAYNPGVLKTNTVSSEINNTVGSTQDSNFHNGKEGITSAVFHYDVYGYQTNTWGGEPTYVTFTPKTKIDIVFPKQYEIRNGNLLTGSHYVPTRKEVESVIANFYKNAPTGAANMTDKTFSALNREANEGINPDLPPELRRLFGGDFYDVDVTTSTTQLLATTLDCLQYSGSLDWNTEAVNGYIGSDKLTGTQLLNPKFINMLILKAFGEYQYYSCYKLYTDNDPGIVELFISRSIADQYWDFKDSLKNYSKGTEKESYKFDDIMNYVAYLDKRYSPLRSNVSTTEYTELNKIADKETGDTFKYLVSQGYYSEDEITKRLGRDFTKQDLETLVQRIYRVINREVNVNTRVE